MNNMYHWVEQLVWVGQLGFSLLFPLLCFLGDCWWLNTRMGVGVWVYVPGFLLGLAVGGSTFAAFVRQWLRQAKGESKPRPGGFNQH